MQTDSNETTVVSPAEFPQAQNSGKVVSSVPLSRFYDVKVRITAELGRLQMTLGELMELGQGSVLELDRTVSDPLDIVAQGVRIAGGEVVVIQDRYGIRITEIEDVAPVSPTGAPGNGAAARVQK